MKLSVELNIVARANLERDLQVVLKRARSEILVGK